MARLTGIGKQLRHLRRAEDYTQQELAERLHVSKSAISAYEQDRKVPSLETLIQLATYFNVSVDYLLGVEQDTMLDLSGLSQDSRDSVRNLVRALK